MHRLLAVLIVALLAADVTVLATGAADPDEPAREDRASPRGGGVVVNEVPPEGQAEITGDLSTLQATAERLAPIPTPVVIDVPQRGQGGATVEGAVVDGERVSIVWGAPSPLRLSGDGGGVVLGPATVTAGSQVVWYLDGAVHGFRPGRYRIDSPVAVGSAALASPRDSVTFEADDRTTLSTRGGAFVAGDPRPLHVEGPGELTARGTFDVVTMNGLRTAVELRFGPGAFVVDLTPAPVGWEATMVVNGPIQVQ